MTEQPNTAAIREGSAAFPDDLLWHRTQTLALCNALDAARTALGLSINALVAARAERDAWEAAHLEALQRTEAWKEINRCTAEGPCSCNHRAVVAEAELAASERWRHDTAIERDYEVGRRIAAEARGAEVYDQLQDARRRIAAALSAGTYVEMVEALTEGITP